MDKYEYDFQIVRGKEDSKRILFLVKCALHRCIIYENSNILFLVKKRKDIKKIFELVKKLSQVSDRLSYTVDQNIISFKNGSQINVMWIKRMSLNHNFNFVIIDNFDIIYYSYLKECLNIFNTDDEIRIMIYILDSHKNVMKKIENDYKISRIISFDSKGIEKYEYR